MDLNNILDNKNSAGGGLPPNHGQPFPGHLGGPGTGMERVHHGPMGDMSGMHGMGPGRNSGPLPGMGNQHHYGQMPFAQPYPQPGQTQMSHPPRMEQNFASMRAPQAVIPAPATVKSESSTSTSTPQAKSFECATCRKGFARRSDLARHERIHSGIRPHICDFDGCGKQFIQRSALTVHSRVHTGEKPHMCEHCAKPFSDSSSLARHRRIHSGKRPYKCPYADCQKTFTRRTTLTRHQNHHSGTVEESRRATEATLASRPPPPIQQRSHSDRGTLSESGSIPSTPTFGEVRSSSLSPAGEMGQMPLPTRGHGEYPYMNGLPPHLRGFDTGQPRSPTGMSSFVQQRPSVTSYPQMYGPPPTLEPPANQDNRTPGGSAVGSPHLSAQGWQSPNGGSFGGSPHLQSSEGFGLPDGTFALAGHHQQQMYYPQPSHNDVMMRRNRSSEPEHYDTKARNGANQMWAA